MHSRDFDARCSLQAPGMLYCLTGLRRRVFAPISASLGSCKARPLSGDHGKIQLVVAKELQSKVFGLASFV